MGVVDSDRASQSEPLVGCGGVVLCGGESRRMGRSKAWLPFGEEALLQRVVRTLQECLSPIVVVAQAEQSLPTLPAEVLRTHDEHPGRGPLEGLRVGLGGIAGKAEVAFVTSCDVPLLQAAFVRAMLDRLGEHQVVVPVDDRFHHPLAAVYRTSVHAEIEALLQADQRRPIALFDRVSTLRIPVEELRDVDPALDSLRNVNLPEDYEAALRAAGFADQ